MTATSRPCLQVTLNVDIMVIFFFFYKVRITRRNNYYYPLLKCQRKIPVITQRGTVKREGGGREGMVSAGDRDGWRRFADALSA